MWLYLALYLPWSVHGVCTDHLFSTSLRHVFYSDITWTCTQASYKFPPAPPRALSMRMAGAMQRTSNAVWMGDNAMGWLVATGRLGGRLRSGRPSHPTCLASHLRKLRCRDSAGWNPGRQDDAQVAQQPPCSAATFRAAAMLGCHLPHCRHLCRPHRPRRHAQAACSQDTTTSSHTPCRRALPVTSHRPCPLRPTHPAHRVPRTPPVASHMPRPSHPTCPPRRVPHVPPVASPASHPSCPACPAVASHAPRHHALPITSHTFCPHSPCCHMSGAAPGLHSCSRDTMTPPISKVCALSCM